MSGLAKIAMLWMHGRLSWLEQLCIRSFQDAGHEVALYSYEKIGCVPKGVEWRDATAILAPRQTLVHRKSGSPAPHADLFRYHLLAQTEGLIWADTDAYCRLPFRARQGHFHGWESEKEVNIGVLGLPRGSATLEALIDFTADEYAIPYWLDPSYVAELAAARDAGRPVSVGDQVWAVWGPKAFTHFLRQTGEIAHSLPREVLYPVSFADRRQLVRQGVDLSDRITERTASIHLYGRRMRKHLVQKHGGLPPPGGLLGQLVKAHGIDPAEAPLPGSVIDPSSRWARHYAQGTSARRDITPAGHPILKGDAAEEAYASVTARSAKRLARLAPIAEAPPSSRITLVSSMRNEAPFILEWNAYHRSIGVTDFLVFTNDCSDPTVEILDRLQSLGLLTRLDNPFDAEKGQKPQRIALNIAAEHPSVTEADWVIVTDNDEFIDVHVGDGTLSALIEAAGHPNVISLTWRMFGNGGVHSYEDRFVTEQFLRAAPRFLPKPRLGWGFKSMVHRSAPFAKIGVHRPLDLAETRRDEVRWVNGSGLSMPERLLEKNEWFSRKDTIGYDLATLNHYVLRSADSYLVKRQRGRINHVDQDQGFGYWAKRNFATEKVETILPKLPRARAVFDELMRDPDLARLHRRAVDWHRGRIAELKALPDYRALYDAITAPDLEDALFLAPWMKHAEQQAAAAAE